MWELPQITVLQTNSKIIENHFLAKLTFFKLRFNLPSFQGKKRTRKSKTSL